MLKNPPADAGDVGSIPGSGRSHAEGNGRPLQHSCLGNFLDRGAWRAAVHWVAKKLDTAGHALTSHCQCMWLPRTVSPAPLHVLSTAVSQPSHFTPDDIKADLMGALCSKSPSLPFFCGSD